MDSKALYRARLVLINLIAMLTAMGLTGIGKSLYLTPKTNVGMAMGLITLLLGVIFVCSFPATLRHLTKGESNWERLQQNRCSLWVNAGINAGMPLILVFVSTDGLQLLGTSAAPLYFRLSLGLAMLIVLLCSVLILRHFARFTPALKG